MNTYGWIILVVSWTGILLFSGFCFWKVFMCRKENIHAPLDIETEEEETNMQQ